jgi:hypothetical protein
MKFSSAIYMLPNSDPLHPAQTNRAEDEKNPVGSHKLGLTFFGSFVREWQPEGTAAGMGSMSNI